MAASMYSKFGGGSKGSKSLSIGPGSSGCNPNSQMQNPFYTGQGSLTTGELYGVGALNIFGQLTDKENILSQVLGLDGNGMDPVRFNLLVAFWVITSTQLRYRPPLLGVGTKYDYSKIIFSAEQKNPFYRIECIELIKNESGTRWDSDGPCLENLPGGSAAAFTNLNVNAQGKKIAGTVKK